MQNSKETKIWNATLYLRLSRMSRGQPFVRIYASSLSSNEISVSAKLTLTTYFPCR